MEESVAQLLAGRLAGRSAILFLAITAAIVVAGVASAQVAFDPIVNVSKTSGDSRQPFMALDASGTFHLAWADDTGNPGIYKVRYARSFDGGKTFSTLSSPVSGGDTASLRPRIAVFGQNVYIAWMQDTNTGTGAKEIMFARSVNGGDSFGPPANLSNSAGESLEARIGVTPTGTVVVVWDEASPSRRIAIARSFDGGVTFQPGTIAPVVTPAGCPPGGVGNCETVYPSLAIDPANGNIYVVWHDLISGAPQVLFSRSVDGGGSFSSPKNISNAPIHAHCASVTVGFSGKVLVAYESRKDLSDHKHNATLVQSSDQGTSFTAPVNVSNSPSWALSDYPYAAEAPDGTIIVGYEDNAASGDLDAVIKVSNDGGATFGSRQDVSNNPTTLSTEVITLFGSDGTFYMVWEDYQPGHADIFFARAPGAAGGVSLVALGLTANKTTFTTGEVLQLGVTAQNPGPATKVDAYLGVILPAILGPGLGCPQGDAVVFFVPGGGIGSLSCLSQLPTNTTPLVKSFPFPAGMAQTSFPDVFALIWTPSVPPGTYVFFMVLTRPNAFADGQIDSSDILSAASQVVTLQ
jgi:hypothetical protein